MDTTLPTTVTLADHARQLPRIAGRLYGEPWNILPQHHGEICRLFRSATEHPHSARPIQPPPRPPYLARAAYRSAATEPVGPTWRDENGRLQPFAEQVTVVENVAILPVRGVLGKHLSTLDLMCGGCDYNILAAQARNIATDPDIAGAIVYLDSPGGNCVGNLEAAQAIRALAQAKPTVAYTDAMCASAAYMIAASADEILSAPSALVGSISTYSAFLDSSRRHEMEGLEIKMFRSGKFKGAGYPGKPWTEEEEQEMQRLTDEYSQQFKGYVAARRGLGPAEMEGQVWVAQFAPAGLVSSATHHTLDEVLDLLLGS
jgi:signal peptide peptidase SppA